MADLGEGQTGQRNRRQRDADLLVGVRRTDASALREFVQRFEHMLLDQARKLGVRRSERRTVVTEFLDDVLVKLAACPAPRALTSFVVTSFRNFAVDMSRLRARLIRESIAHLPELPASDRAILVRLLDRAGVKIEDDKPEGSTA